MEIAFLDANVLFSAAYRPQAGLTRLWRLESIRLITSAYALEEARRNLHMEEQRIRLDHLAESVGVVAEAPGQLGSLEVDLPDKDWPILLAAMQAGATHLITGDVSHFGPYYGRAIQGVLVLSPGMYLRSHPE